MYKFQFKIVSSNDTGFINNVGDSAHGPIMCRYFVTSPIKKLSHLYYFSFSDCKSKELVDDEIAKALLTFESSEDEEEIENFSFNDTNLNLDIDSALDRILPWNLRSKVKTNQNLKKF